MKSARAWKTFYAQERRELGDRGLLCLLDDAEPLAAPAKGMIFPHTRLATSGALCAAAALSAVRSGADEVLAIGVLHGAREADAESVQRARAGDPDARAALRRVHGPGAPHDTGHAEEEFSLDGFSALIEAAARREGRSAPRLILRYPFLTGADPRDLPGWDEIDRALDRGAALVATADMIHHGAGYGTPPADRLEGDRALEFARSTTLDLTARLAAGDYEGHERRASEVRSDFRDAGPVFASLLRSRGGFAPALRSLQLVDYADVFGAEKPTWVAAALFTS
jgi:hypothetical protein